jgi:hypothetical protein
MPFYVHLFQRRRYKLAAIMSSRHGSPPRGTTAPLGGSDLILSEGVAAGGYKEMSSIFADQCNAGGWGRLRGLSQ